VKGSKTLKPAPIPDNEHERLSALQQLKILDTSIEASFDEITALAAELCGTPIALVSLIDESRQWFKSSYGLEAKETARDISFCGHAILQDQLFEIPDSSSDDRFNDNPLVVGGPNVAFYAGVPLFTANKLAMGTLCVIDSKPKKLTDFQRRVLLVLGNQVSHLLEMRRLTNLLSEAKALEAALAVVATFNHEINNPLMIAMGLFGSNKKHLPEVAAEKISDSLKRIDNCVRKINLSLRENGIEYEDYYGESKMLKVDK
jgi:hypothetical protein